MHKLRTAIKTRRDTTTGDEGWQQTFQIFRLLTSTKTTTQVLDGRNGLKRLERLFIGMKLEDDKQKRALLLHYAGPDVDDIFDTLTDTGEDKDYKKAVEKLNEYFNPQINTTYEVYNFRTAKQKEEESLDTYHTRLRQLAKTCEFADADKEIKEHIILTCTSNALRRRALRENFSLKDLLQHGRALELSESQATQVEKTESQVNAVKDSKRSYQKPAKDTDTFRSRARQPKPQSHKPTSRTYENKQKTNSKKKICFHCGGDFPHRDECPAKDQECRSCGKIGHFARICRTNPQRNDRVRNITQDVTQDTQDNEVNEYSEDEYAWYTGNHKSSSNLPSCNILIGKKQVKMMIDSGANQRIDIQYHKSRRRPSTARKGKVQDIPVWLKDSNTCQRSGNDKRSIPNQENDNHSVCSPRRCRKPVKLRYSERTGYHSDQGKRPHQQQRKQCRLDTQRLRLPVRTH